MFTSKSRNNIIVLLSVAVMLITGAISTSLAALIQVDWTGIISDNTQGTLPDNGAFGITFALNDIISGSFIYNTNSPATTVDPNGRTFYDNAVSSFDFSLNGTTVEAINPPFQATVYDNWFSRDAFYVDLPGVNWQINGGSTEIGSGNFLLQDNSITAFSDESLPSSLDINDFNQLDFNHFVDNSGDLVIFTLQTVTTGEAIVPEPSTYALILTGFIGLGFLRRNRRKTDKIS